MISVGPPAGCLFSSVKERIIKHLEVLNSLLLGRSILIISCGTYVIAVYESLIRSIKSSAQVKIMQKTAAMLFK